MKRPIDPNLNNSNDDELLLDIEGGEPEFSFNDYREPTHEPLFKVSETQLPKRSENPIKKADGDAPIDAEIKEDGSEHRHHSSSGSHHHHHHSSSGEHSSSSEHSSSGEHHSSGKHRSSGSSRHGSSHSSSHRHHSSHSSSSSKHSSSHHHSSSGGKKKKKKGKLPLPAKIAAAIIAIILIAALVVSGTFFYMYLSGKKSLTTHESTEYQEIIEYNGHHYKFNDSVAAFGFVGVDQRGFETSDRTDFVGAGDADIVIAVDTKTGKTSLIAIPRDTMVDVDVTTESGIFLRTQQAQLCLAYAYGDGAEKSCLNSIGAMSRVLYSVPIEKYFVLDLDGIAALNDAIGGVTVESLYTFKDAGINKGDTVTLRGSMAETYVRERDMTTLTASLDRLERQKQYVGAYVQQLLPAVANDFGVIADLYNTASAYSQTNITLNNATYMASLLLSKGVTTYDTYTIKGEMKAAADPLLENVVHAELYPYEESVMETVLAVFYTQID